MDIPQNGSIMIKLPMNGMTDKVAPIPPIPASNLRPGIYTNGDLYATKETCNFAGREDRSNTVSTTITAETDDSTVIAEGDLPDREKGLSWSATLMNFMKGMIGPGCLSLPLAFKQAGLWTAFGLVFAFGFLNNHCMLQLVHCSQHLSKRKGHSKLDYGGVAYEACAHSFKFLRPYKNLAKAIVNTAILGLQLGICSVFYVFMALHMKEIFDDETSFKVSATAWMFIILPPVILLNFLRSLRTIAIFSMIGNVLMIGAFIFILQHLLRADHVMGQLPWITNFDGVMTACGSILYSFEGQAMVLPLENKLKHPPSMVGPFGVLSVGMSLVSTVYAGSGFFGYITYGTDVKGSITLNLPQQAAFTAVKLMLTLVVYFGFVIQQYVIVDMIWPKIVRRMDRSETFSNNRLHLPLELLFRAFLVIIAMTVAIAVPNLEEIIPLVGVTAGMMLAFIFPALMDTMTFVPLYLNQKCADGTNGRRKAYLRLIKNGFLVLIGMFGLAAGLSSNIRNMIQRPISA
ncbi:transmembrane amino acid transporter protein domain-containing protein [Ditylenchus destructor]|uniref:Transmembrane amino acid transporter protein domain-containing protein n=1 Tax=Ditylenchus destructor TaxID=166010 RepID=A0AAD4MVP3_9BILA|nr:transmembrane amino acid transporter protein domain-containing protein [Ditylenchus destructor]